MGVSVVNALSESLELNIYRDGNEYEIKFKDGSAKKPIKKIGKTKKMVQKYFFALNQIFSSTHLVQPRLKKELENLPFCIRNINKIN